MCGGVRAQAPQRGMLLDIRSKKVPWALDASAAGISQPPSAAMHLKIVVGRWQRLRGVST